MLLASITKRAPELGLTLKETKGRLPGLQREIHKVLESVVQRLSEAIKGKKVRDFKSSVRKYLTW